MKKNIDKEIRKLNYETADSNAKLILNFRDINHTMHFLYEGRTSQNRILILLLEKENITQQELTEILGIKPGSASEVIAKLENNGLIKRTKSIFDRRTANINLTDKGRVLAEDAKNKRELRHKEMFCVLSDDEKNTLISLLEKINSNWEEIYFAENSHSTQRNHHKGRHHDNCHHHSDYHNFKSNHQGSGKKNDCDGNCRECKHPCH